MLIAVASPAAAHAEPADAARANDTAQHAQPKKRETVRYTRHVDKLSLYTGGARVRVRAPAERVRATVTRYEEWQRIVPQFDRAKVVRRGKKSTDVYLRVPILRGASHIWAVVRFGPVKKIAKDTWVVRGSMVRGNVARFIVEYRVKQLSEKRALLDLELLIDPDLPFGKKLIADHTADAAGKMVRKLRARAEQKPLPKRAPPRARQRRATSD